MRALFISKNLIGDALYVQPSLKAWSEKNPEWSIDLLTLDDQVACLYEGMEIGNLRVLRNKADLAGHYDFQHTFDVSGAFALGDKKSMHISHAYMELLGLEVPVGLPVVVYKPPVGDFERDLILVSMFSRSCASREGKLTNKMLGWGHWLSVIALIRQLGSPVRFLGGPDDRAPLPILEEEYLTGKPLEWVARTMASARLLVTIDNGMGHLAATQKLPTILFYPKCLGIHWIVPTNKHLFLLHMDPAELSIPDAELFVRKGLQKLWEGDQHEEK
jgi:hypothetical protein